MSQMGINSLVIDSWFYWEYEQFIKLLNEKNKDENDQRKKQEESESSKYSSVGNFNPGKMMNNFSPSSVMKNFGNMGNNTAGSQEYKEIFNLLFLYIHKNIISNNE